MEEVCTRIKDYPALIGGQRTSATSGETLCMRSPSNGEVFARIPRCSASDVGRAVAAAKHAFKQGAWPRLSAPQRGRLLSHVSRMLAEREEEFVELEALDTGKPLSQARADVKAAIRYFEFYGGAADKISGETLPTLSEGFSAFTLRQPHGVIAAVIPWNYPLQIISRIAGAALAMGNTLVVKPSEDACLSVIRLGEIMSELGFPAGVFNVVTGYGDEAGAALAHNLDVNFLTFTGSPEVGTFIQSAAARNHIGCTLELGGKSPQILFEDADLDAAVPAISKALTQNGGQTCSAGSRVLVQENLWDEACNRLRTKFRAVVAGPHEQDLDFGPLINASQARRVAAYCAQAEKDGVPLLAEGTLVPDIPPEGYYRTARLYGPVPAHHPLAQEEVFGPVLAMIPFKDEQEAIEIANATAFGLVAGVWTRDLARSMRVVRAVECGQVFVNAYGAGGGVELPFGGVKKSGHGREKGFEALKEFSSIKTVVINHG
ncbi:aldehyde dehydrogenase family protein [Flexibacterium corallicola]|uniref:aldehyde dehydrogenase family protein n=1 Tax=Flexibacterium corallicola TaxID=3037259 RepID=UPI00286F551E|nr:aldehyde dehydrogenase family protein [Pseudovibrio sp. M1P-2-3]